MIYSINHNYSFTMKLCTWSLGDYNPLIRSIIQVFIISINMYVIGWVVAAVVEEAQLSYKWLFVSNDNESWNNKNK